MSLSVIVKETLNASLSRAEACSLLWCEGDEGRHSGFSVWHKKNPVESFRILIGALLGLHYSVHLKRWLYQESV